ncbi:MAG: glycosyltransferase [Deltaproteobacteria bacterium]|nr:glycosyltransferase [Deltaproteobacteria bacterium]
MKNFLLVNPTFGVRHPPLGLGYLAGYLKKYYPGGHRFRLIDYAWQTDRDLNAALSDFPPDLIGITATTNTFPEARRIAALIKTRCAAPIIIGGVHITAMPEDLLGSPFDLAVLGEGEETLLRVVEHFDRTGGVHNEQINGLAFQSGDRLVQTPPRPLIDNLDHIPMPDYNLFAMRDFYTRPKALAHGFYAKGASLMPSRGCPYGDCSFCGSGLMWRRRVRFFSPQRVFEEIRFLINTFGLNSVIFLDDNFTTKRAWLEELAALISAGDFYPFFKFDCESIAEYLDDHKARLLKSMGCERVEFGFESGCQRILSELKNQRADVAKSIAAIELCKKHGLKILGNFIFGWPDETRAEVLETYDFIQKHPIDYVAWHTLAPYPGTRVWRLWEEKFAQGPLPFRREDFYHAETCNTHFALNPYIDPAQAKDIYEKMRRQAYLSNTQVVHELNLTAGEREELWQAFWQDMERLNLRKPSVSLTKPNTPEKLKELRQSRESPSEDSLEFMCRRLEGEPELSTADIMAEFDLLTGHPWEHHTQSPVTNYYACLYGLARSSRPSKILEIGTGFGLSAAALLKASHNLELLVSLDLGIFGDQYGFGENNQAFARRRIHHWCAAQGIPVERVKFFQANTQPPGRTDNDNVECQAPHWSEIADLKELLTPASFDLVFVDGKHTEDGLYNDLKTFWPFLKPGGLLICDDLHDESYREVFAWAGDALASFEKFTGEFSPGIEEHYIWPFPRVLPPGREGVRPFGIIRKKTAASMPVQPPVIPPSCRACREQPDFEALIRILARHQQRLYYRDQSPAGLAALVKLAEAHQPTKIVELGTLSGLSLRAWLAADTQAEIIAVDLSFAALQQSLKPAPLDLCRVRLLERNIRQTDFRRLWEPGDRVLLYLDAHDQPDAPIMEHLLEQALPILPAGSLVVVDDLWYSPETLTPANARAFFRNRVFHEIDPLQCFSGAYASYWQGGSFMGFAEVGPFIAWVNARRIPLNFQRDQKCASFEWPGDTLESKTVTTPKQDQVPAMSISYHPLADVAVMTSGTLAFDAPTIAALNLHQEAVKAYGLGSVPDALAFLAQAATLPHRLSGLRYGQAVCLARLGRFEEATASLEEELRLPFPHEYSLRLLSDLRDRLSEAESVGPFKTAHNSHSPGLTIFACPKAFAGHTAIIQRNAILSWTKLNPAPEIILFGNDPGVADIAGELGLRHVAEVDLSQGGTPLVSSLLRQGQESASGELLAYVNADIILGPDFMDAVAGASRHFQNFLMIGRRWDADVKDPLEFNEPDWWKKLVAQTADSRTLHAESALDYFVFTRNLWPQIPEFALGRTAWDNWLAAQPLLNGVPVVDATPYVTAIHQNHDYSHVQGGHAGAWKGEEAGRNQDLAWTSPFLAYSSHAPWEVAESGEIAARERQQRFLALGREGLAILREGRPGPALDRFDEMLNLMPEGIPGLQYVRALALNELGRQEDAVSALRQELASHSTHRRARELLAALENTGRESAGGNPKISVVIPTHNRARYLPEAIQSVLNQGCDDLEVLVVDDGSTDDTPEVMAEMTDPRVRYLRKEKTGAPDTRNWGIANARGEWLLWLDSDDTLMPGWLSKLAGVLADGDGADVYYGNLVVVDAAGQPLRTLRYEDYADSADLLLASLLQGNPIPLGGSLTRASLLREAGGFDTDFPRAHDYELWSRLVLQARFRHINRLALAWRWHDGNMSSGSVTRDLSYDAEIVKRLLRRHPLKDFFPDLDWEDWPRAQAQAARLISEIFRCHGDEDAAREWLQEAAGLAVESQTQPEAAVHG